MLLCTKNQQLIGSKQVSNNKNAIIKDLKMSK